MHTQQTCSPVQAGCFRCVGSKFKSLQGPLRAPLALLWARCWRSHFKNGKLSMTAHRIEQTGARVILHAQPSTVTLHLLLARHSHRRIDHSASLNIPDVLQFVTQGRPFIVLEANDRVHCQLGPQRSMRRPDPKADSARRRTLVDCSSPG